MQGSKLSFTMAGLARAIGVSAVAILAAALVSGCAAARAKLIDDAAAEGRTEEMIEAAANDLSAKTPKTYGNGIVWASARRKGYEIENVLTLPSNTNTKGKESEIARIVKDRMATSLCRRADVKRLMYHGMTIRMIVKDHRGRSIANDPISHGDC